MRADRIRLANFRCFAEVDLDLGEGLTVVMGPNAGGKTSLLEGLFVASAGRSPRARRDAELVRWGASQALVDVVFRQGDGRTTQVRVGVEIGAGGLRKVVTAGEKPVRRASELLSRLPVVLFTPADLQLAQAEPAIRRRFMNLALARLRPAYVDDLARYKRALQQRNRLLQMEAPAGQVRPWTEQLVQCGAQVACHRAWLAGALAELAPGIHAELAGPGEALGVAYAGDLHDASDSERGAEGFRRLLEQRAAEEQRLRRTPVGPHRDDLRLLINGQRLRQFGSQGQQRTAALALKLAEADLVRRQSGESPIVLLDDCLSELDEERAGQVLRLTGAYEQLIVTLASREPALAAARVRSWVHLSAGKVTSIERK